MRRERRLAFHRRLEREPSGLRTLATAIGFVVVVGLVLGLFAAAIWP